MATKRLRSTLMALETADDLTSGCPDKDACFFGSEAQTCAPLITDDLSFIILSTCPAFLPALQSKKRQKGSGTDLSWERPLQIPLLIPVGNFASDKPTPLKSLFVRLDSYEVLKCLFYPFLVHLWKKNSPLPHCLKMPSSFHQKRNLNWHWSPKEVHSL